MKRMIFVMFVSTMSLTALAKPWHAYSGPDLPRNQIAVLYIPIVSRADLGYGISIMEVDGHSVANDWDGIPRTVKKCFYPNCPRIAAPLPDSIELLPGKHTIVFFVSIAQPPQNINQDIIVEAGKKYKAKLKNRVERVHVIWEGAIVDGQVIQPAVKYRWWIEID